MEGLAVRLERWFRRATIIGLAVLGLGWVASEQATASTTGPVLQEGPRLVPGDETGGASEFGSAIGLSADGSTAVVGGPGDGVGGTGAAWIYTRTSGAWSEQVKLSPTD